jgi:hypothetical protein
MTDHTAHGHWTIRPHDRLVCPEGNGSALISANLPASP